MQLCPSCNHNNRDNARYCAQCQAELLDLLGANTILQSRYEVLQVLGCGGMGAVYLAEHTSLGRKKVALKENFDASSKAQRQFQREAETLAHLNHPNLPTVSDHFIGANGRQYLVMTYVEGQSLAERLEQAGGRPLSETEVLAWADQLLDALDYCHRRSVIHRDIKPQNIIIQPDGQAMLVDFGLVKLYDPTSPSTSTFMLGMGTPEYAPPEQYGATTEHTEARSDLYSLGATLYHLLTGQVPPTSTQRTASPNILTPPRQLNPNLSPPVEAAILQAIALPLASRFQNAAEMRQALQPAGGPLPRPAPTSVPPWIWALGGAVVMLVVVGLLALVTGRGLSGDLGTPAVALLPATPTPINTITAVPISLTNTPTDTPVTPTSTPTATSTHTPIPTDIPVTPTSTPTATSTHTPIPTDIPVTPTSTPTATSIPTSTPVTPNPGDIHTDSHGVPMVYVPAGPFEMGSSADVGLAECKKLRSNHDECQRSWFEDEEPVHTITLYAFYIDQYEVTNAQFAVFLNEQGSEGGAIWLDADDGGMHIHQQGGIWQVDDGYADHPVIKVSWYGARAYCEWRGTRLPTEAEWEKAARGVDGRLYPWGNEFDGRRANFCDSNCEHEWANRDYDDGYAFTAPVGFYSNGISPYGVYDMAGNVWEWVQSEYRDYPYQTDDGREDSSGTNARVLRGGSWYNVGDCVRAALRDDYNLTVAYYEVGFRCVR